MSSDRFAIGVDFDLGDGQAILDGFEKKLGTTIDRSKGLEHALVEGSRAVKEQSEKLATLKTALDHAAIGGHGLARATEMVNEGMRLASESMESLERFGGSAGEAFGSLARTISSMARGDLVGFVMSAHRGAMAIAEMATESDRQVAALEHLGAAYELVTSATNDTMDETDAFRMQQRLLEAGLQLTGQELATVAGFAREHARALGVDATTATENLTSALIAGSARGLRPYGISIDSNATRGANLNTILARMATNLGTTGVSARTAAEDMHLFDRELGDTANELGRSAASALHLSDIMHGLTDIIRDTGGVATAMSAAVHAAFQLSHLNVFGAANTIAAYNRQDQEASRQRAHAEQETLDAQHAVVVATDAARARGLDLTRVQLHDAADMVQLANTLRTYEHETLAVQQQQVDAIGDQRRLSGLRERDAAAYAENERTRLANGDAAAGATPAAARHGGGAHHSHLIDMQAAARAENARQEAEESRQEAAETEAAERAAERSAQEKAAEEMRVAIERKAAESRVYHEQEEALRTHNEHILQEEKQHARAIQDARRTDSNLMRETWMANLHLHETENQRMADFTTSAYHTMTGALEQHIAAVIEGNETGGAAARAAFHQISMALGMQAGEQMVMELAAGFGMLGRAAGSYGADVGAEVSATQHFVSAGIYGTLAGAGFAGAAASNAPKQAGASGGVAPSAAASLGRTGGQANDNGGATIINVNIGGTVISGRDIAPAVSRGLVELHGSRRLPGFMR